MTVMETDMPDKKIAVQITQQFQDVEVDLQKLSKLVKAICNRFGLSKTTVSIGIVDDAEIQIVNAEFLDRKSVTDCISFDLSDDNEQKIFDIVVNGEKAVREANQREHSAQAELALYITHGMLHNLGFDDSTKTKAKKMHDTEDEILQQHGFGLVYNSE